MDVPEAVVVGVVRSIVPLLRVFFFNETNSSKYSNLTMTFLAGADATIDLVLIGSKEAAVYQDVDAEAALVVDEVVRLPLFV